MKLLDILKDLEEQHDELTPKCRVGDSDAISERSEIDAKVDKVMALMDAGFDSVDEIIELITDKPQPVEPPPVEVVKAEPKPKPTPKPKAKQKKK